jgi:glycosyltransferase involved in cell wall biosynthesis
MKKLLLVGNYVADRQHSMLRYAAWLESNLKRNGFEVDLIQPDVLFGRLAGSSPVALKWLGYVDKLIVFPFRLLAVARRYQAVHICDHVNAVYHPVIRGRPVIVTCHDLLGVRVALGEFLGQQTRLSGRILQKWVLAALKRVQFVCCVSQATRDDFVRLCDGDGRHVGIIHNPVSGFAPLPGDEADILLRDAGIDPDRRFFFHVGTNTWYKNRIGVLALFDALRRRKRFQQFDLVLAGQGLTDQLQTVIADHALDDRVRVVTDPSVQLLRALYGKSSALLFISLHEGFGWPIIEAQACGCPVITSNREPMKSIGGTAAFVVEADAPVESAARIDDQWPWICAQRLTSIENAKRFREDDVLEKYLAFYQFVFQKWDAASQGTR